MDWTHFPLSLPYRTYLLFAWMEKDDVGDFVVETQEGKLQRYLCGNVPPNSSN